jgi:hypothetical protein
MKIEMNIDDVESTRGGRFEGAEADPPGHRGAHVDAQPFSHTYKRMRRAPRNTDDRSLPNSFDRLEGGCHEFASSGSPHRSCEQRRRAFDGSDLRRDQQP